MIDGLMVLLLWSMSHITGLIVGSVGLGEELDLFITQYRDATIATTTSVVIVTIVGGSGSGGSSRVILLLRSAMLLHLLVILIMVIMVVMSGQCGKPR